MKKIRVVQYGVTHEHAVDKITTLQKMSDIFEIVGVVDDHTTLSPRYPKVVNISKFDKFPLLSPEEFSRRNDVELVLIDVTNADIIPTAQKCLAKGIAMHMEKPGGEEIKPFDDLVFECERRQIPFQMGYMLRANPAMNFCIDAVRRGIIGEVFEVYADMNHCYGGEDYVEYLSSFRGGIMYNLCCHFIDFIVRFMGKPANIYSLLKTSADSPANSLNNCIALLEYPHAVASVRACSKDHGLGRRLRIAGTKGVIDLCPTEDVDIPLHLELSLGEKSGDYPEGRHVLTFPPMSDRYAPQLLELAQIIRGEIPNVDFYAHDRLVNHINLACSKIVDWRDVKDLL